MCRLSHHSAHTLTQIEDPYLAIEEATTYELTACYNVSIDCFSGDMRANIHTNTLFSGKVYAKGSPLTCVEDIQQTLDFSITFGYNDLDCGVVREREGSYTNDVIIQHHDSIVTSKDIGLSITCEYDLSNKPVANMVDLTITGEITPSIYEESVVDSPNVIMRVADSQGQDTKTAVVGDSLSMVFEILEDLQKAEKKTIILVEQNAKKGLEFADIGYVLVSGQTAIAGKGDDLLKNSDVGRLFLGG